MYEYEVDDKVVVLADCDGQIKVGSIGLITEREMNGFDIKSYTVEFDQSAIDDVDAFSKELSKDQLIIQIFYPNEIRGLRQENLDLI